MDTQIKEIAQFLTSETRPDIKLPAIEFIAGLTGSPHNAILVAKNTAIIDAAINLTTDEIDGVADAAFTILVNITGDDNTSKYLCKQDNIELLLRYASLSTAKYADKACMVLCNLTRLTEGCDMAIKLLESQNGRQYFRQLLVAFYRSDYNKYATYHHVAAFLANITQLETARKWILSKDDLIIVKCLPYMQYYDSVVRRRGIIALIRNCCFENGKNCDLLYVWYNI